MKGRQPIQVIRGKIQPCQEKERKALEELLEEEESDKAYVFTPTERTKIIVCQIVISGKPTAVEDLDADLSGQQKYDLYGFAGGDLSVVYLSVGTAL